MISESPLKGFFNWIIMLPYFFSCVWSPSDIVGVYLGVHWLKVLEDSWKTKCSCWWQYPHCLPRVEKDLPESQTFLQVAYSLSNVLKKVHQEVILDVMKQ